MLTQDNIVKIGDFGVAKTLVNVIGPQNFKT
jgi:hypothetical protein